MKKIIFFTWFSIIALWLCSQNFTQINKFSLDYSAGKVYWGDYDNDGDLDLLTAVYKDLFLFRYDGDTIFTKITDLDRYNLYDAEVQWVDYNNDGFLDVFYSGNRDNVSKFVMYTNNGDGSFSDSVFITHGNMLDNTKTAWADYDNDGDMDFVCSGSVGINFEKKSIIYVYRNDGGLNFTPIDYGFNNIHDGSLDWGDYNNDGFVDLIITGTQDNQNNQNTFLYKNNGNNTFTYIETDLPSTRYGNTDWADFDNDGDLDVFVVGQYDNAEIYKNMGNDNFTFYREMNGADMYHGSCGQWFDYDNDGDLDIFITGSTSGVSPYGPISNLYQNDNNIAFTQVNDNIPSYKLSWFDIADFDGDGDGDIAIVASDSLNNTALTIYRNENSTANIVPAAPTGLYAEGTDNIILRWNKATDSETNQNALTYNVLITTHVDSANIKNPQSNLATGLRKVKRRGNADLNNFQKTHLPSGTYYWTVQAIDNAFAGSPFAELDTFTVPVTSFFETTTNACRYGSVVVTYLGNADTSAEYIWSFDGATVNSGTGQGPYEIYYTTPGTKTIQLQVVENNDTSSITTHTVSITPINAPTPDFIFDASTCKNSLVEIHYTGTGNATDTYTWAFDNATIHKGDDAGPYQLYWEEAGAKYVSLTVSNSNCTSVTQTSEITVNDINPPTIDIVKNDISPAAANFSYTGDASVNATYEWDFGLGNIVGGQDAGPIEVYWTESLSTNYIKLTVTDNGCSTLPDSINFQTSLFTSVSGLNFPQIENGVARWGDYDNDGDLDVLIQGSGNCKVYNNQGNGQFTLYNMLDNTSNGDAAWGDYDNDGDLDILLTGYDTDNSVKLAKIYQYDHIDYTFDDIQAGLTPVHTSAVAWGDYNNDGFLDVLLTGQSDDTRVSIIYKNNGDNTFMDINAGLTGIYRGDVAWGDYDNDGDLDILMTGRSQNAKALIYKNNGDDTFTEIQHTIEPVQYSAANWVDYDDDGDLDVFVMGDDNSKYLILYKNIGNDTFETVDWGYIPGAYFGDAAWGDYDNDGDADLIYVGKTSSSYDITAIMRNDGNDVFTEVENLMNYGESSVDLGDFDNDGDLDIILSGVNSYTGNPSDIRIYENNLHVSNEKPDVPEGLNAVVAGSKAILSWQPSADTETAQNGLSYNISIGTNASIIERLSPMSDTIIGTRFLPQIGNAGHNLFYHYNLDGIPFGTECYWQVQAVDKGYNASAFSVIDTFTVDLSAYFTANNTCGNDTTVVQYMGNADTTVAAFNWDFGTATVLSGSNHGPYLLQFADNGAHSISLQVIEDNDTVSYQQTVYAFNQATLSYLSDTVFCLGDSVVLSANQGGYAYDWYQGTSTLVGQSQTYSAKESGNYFVSVTDTITGCVLQSENQTVVVNDLPEVNITNLDTDYGICVEAFQVTATPSGGTFNGQGIENTDYFNPSTAGIGGPYTVVYEYTDVNSCTNSDTQLVTIHALPTVTFDDGLDATYCSADASVDLASYGLPSGGTFSGNGISNTEFSPQEAGFGGPYNIVYTYSEYGCVVSDTQYVEVLQSPSATIYPAEPPVICEGDSVLFYTAGGQNYAYQWHYNGSPIPNAVGNYYSAKQSGNYVVEITDLTNGCAGTSNQENLSFHNNDFDVSFTASPTYFSSPTFDVAFTNNTPNSNTYDFTWYFGDGNDSLSNQTNVNYTYMFNGTYTPMLVAQDKYTGCTDTMVGITPITCLGGDTCRMIISLSAASNSPICTGDTMLLTADITGYYTEIQWVYNNVVLDSADSLTYPATEEGVYQIIVTNDTCTVTSNMVSVVYYPQPNIEIIANGNIQTCTNDSMYLFANIAANDYEWSTGEIGQGIYIDSSGHYTVSIIDLYGCNVTSEPYTLNASMVGTPEICMVTVDNTLASPENMILWEKETTNLIDYYIVYKENVSSDFVQIGTVPYGNDSYFVDYASNPMQNADRYKISAVDTCGFETPMGEHHKTIHLVISEYMGDIYLAWNHYEGYVFDTYVIYRGATQGTLDSLTSIQSNNNSYTDIAPGGTYYYQVGALRPDTCLVDFYAKYMSGPYETSLSQLEYPPSVVKIESNRYANAHELLAYPNPFSNEFTISYRIKQSATVSLEIYNMMGQKIADIDNGAKQAGYYKHQLSAEMYDINAGVYYIKLRVNNDIAVQRLMKIE